MVRIFLLKYPFSVDLNKMLARLFLRISCRFDRYSVLITIGMFEGIDVHLGGRFEKSTRILIVATLYGSVLIFLIRPGRLFCEV